MESWEGLLRKKGYDGSRYQVKSLEVLAGKQGVGWRTKKWHPDGVVSLNQWYYFSPEGWRRLALGLDLREGGDDSDYLTGEGIRKESEQSLNWVNRQLTVFEMGKKAAVAKTGLPRIIMAPTPSQKSSLWPALLLTEEEVRANHQDKPEHVGVKLLCWEGRQDVHLVKPDRCFRVSSEDLLDILKRAAEHDNGKTSDPDQEALQEERLVNFAAGIGWAFALRAKTSSESLVHLLEPVSNRGIQAMSPTLLDDPWGTYSNDDIAAAVPTLQDGKFLVVANAFRELRRRTEQSGVPSTHSQHTSGSQAGSSSQGHGQAARGGGGSEGGEDSNPRPLKRAKEQGQPDTGVEESKQGGGRDNGKGKERMRPQADAQRDKGHPQARQQAARGEDNEMEQEKGRKGPRREEGRQSLDERAQALIKALKALNDQLAKALNKEAPAVSPHLQAAVTFLETMQRGGFEIRDPSWIEDADVTVAYALKVTVGELTSLGEQRKRGMNALSESLFGRHEALLAGLWTPASLNLNSKGVRQRLTDLEVHVRDTETRLQSEKAALGKLEGLLSTLTDDNPAKAFLQQSISAQRQQVSKLTAKLQQLSQEQAAFKQVNEAITPWNKAREEHEEVVAKLKYATSAKTIVEEQWTRLREALKKRTTAQQGE